MQKEGVTKKTATSEYLVLSLRVGMSDEVPLARDVNRIEGL